MTESDVAQLSKLLANELPSDEAEALRRRLAEEPDLVKARERLLALDSEVRSLVVPPPSPAAVDRWVVAAAGPEARPGFRAASPFTQPRFVGALLAGAAVLFTVLALSHRAAGDIAVRTVHGEVARVSGGRLERAASSSSVDSGDRIVTGAGATASLDLGTSTSLDVGPRTQLVLRPSESLGARLEAGTVAASGDPLRVAAGHVEVSVHGRSAIRMEPFEPLDRVMGGREEPMQLASLSKAAALAAGAALVTVAVIEGRALVRENSARPETEVRAPAVWRSDGAPNGRDTGLAGLTAVTRAQLPPQESGRLRIASPAPEDLSAWPKEALAAEIRTLRSRLALAEGKPFEGKAAGREPSRLGRYRDDPETLKAHADDGRVVLRLPQMDEEPLKIADAVRRDVSLTDAEARAVEDVFRESHERIAAELRKLYREAGGDPGVVDALSMTSLWNELRAKSPQGDSTEAVRRIAAERAGLLPPRPDNESTILERGLRMLAREEQRVFDDLDALLGRQRSRAFFEHDNSRRSIWSMAEGPPKK